jgi:hypothetical protein
MGVAIQRFWTGARAAPWRPGRNNRCVAIYGRLCPPWSASIGEPVYVEMNGLTVDEEWLGKRVEQALQLLSLIIKPKLN